MMRNTICTFTLSKDFTRMLNEGEVLDKSNGVYQTDFADWDNANKAFTDYAWVIGPNGFPYNTDLVTTLVESALDEVDKMTAGYMESYITKLKRVYTFRKSTLATDGVHIFFNPGFVMNHSFSGKDPGLFMKLSAEFDAFCKDGNNAEDFEHLDEMDSNSPDITTLCFAIIHEIYHNVFQHLTEWRQKSHEEPDKYNDFNKGNIAMDYEINWVIEHSFPDMRPYDPEGEPEDAPYELDVDGRVDETRRKQIFKGVCKENDFCLNEKFAGLTWMDIYEKLTQKDVENANKNKSISKMKLPKDPDYEDGWRDGWNDTIEEFRAKGLVESLVIPDDVRNAFAALNEAYDESRGGTYDQGYMAAREAAKKMLKDLINGGTMKNGNPTGPDGYPYQIDGLDTLKPKEPGKFDIDDTADENPEDENTANNTPIDVDMPKGNRGQNSSSRQSQQQQQQSDDDTDDSSQQNGGQSSQTSGQQSGQDSEEQEGTDNGESGGSQSNNNQSRNQNGGSQNKESGDGSSDADDSSDAGDPESDNGESGGASGSNSSNRNGGGDSEDDYDDPDFGDDEDESGAGGNSNSSKSNSSSKNNRKPKLSDDEYDDDEEGHDGSDGGGSYGDDDTDGEGNGSYDGSDSDGASGDDFYGDDTDGEGEGSYGDDDADGEGGDSYDDDDFDGESGRGGSSDDGDDDWNDDSDDEGYGGEGSSSGDPIDLPKMNDVNVNWDNWDNAKDHWKTDNTRGDNNQRQDTPQNNLGPDNASDGTSDGTSEPSGSSDDSSSSRKSSDNPQDLNKSSEKGKKLPQEMIDRILKEIDEMDKDDKEKLDGKGVGMADGEYSGDEDFQKDAANHMTTFEEGDKLAKDAGKGDTEKIKPVSTAAKRKIIKDAAERMKQFDWSRKDQYKGDENPLARRLAAFDDITLNHLDWKREISRILRKRAEERIINKKSFKGSDADHVIFSRVSSRKGGDAAGRLIVFIDTSGSVASVPKRVEEYILLTVQLAEKVKIDNLDVWKFGDNVTSFPGTPDVPLTIHKGKIPDKSTFERFTSIGLNGGTEYSSIFLKMQSHYINKHIPFDGVIVITDYDLAWALRFQEDHFPETSEVRKYRNKLMWAVIEDPDRDESMVDYFSRTAQDGEVYQSAHDMLNAKLPYGKLIGINANDIEKDLEEASSENKTEDVDESLKINNKNDINEDMNKEEKLLEAIKISANRVASAARAKAAARQAISNAASDIDAAAGETLSGGSAPVPQTLSGTPATDPADNTQQTLSIPDDAPAAPTRKLSAAEVAAYAARAKEQKERYAKNMNSFNKLLKKFRADQPVKFAEFKKNLGDILDGNGDFIEFWENAFGHASKKTADELNFKISACLDEDLIKDTTFTRGIHITDNLNLVVKCNEVIFVGDEMIEQWNRMNGCLDSIWDEVIGNNPAIGELNGARDRSISVRRIVGDVYIRNCRRAMSLPAGLPPVIEGAVVISMMPNLRNLDGLSERVSNGVEIEWNSCPYLRDARRRGYTLSDYENGADEPEDTNESLIDRRIALGRRFNCLNESTLNESFASAKLSRLFGSTKIDDETGKEIGDINKLALRQVDAKLPIMWSDITDSEIKITPIRNGETDKNWLDFVTDRRATNSDWGLRIFTNDDDKIVMIISGDNKGAGKLDPKNGRTNFNVADSWNDGKSILYIDPVVFDKMSTRAKNLRLAVRAFCHAAVEFFNVMQNPADERYELTAKYRAVSDPISTLATDKKYDVEFLKKFADTTNHPITSEEEAAINDFASTKINYMYFNFRRLVGVNVTREDPNDPKSRLPYIAAWTSTDEMEYDVDYKGHESKRPVSDTYRGLTTYKGYVIDHALLVRDEFSKIIDINGDNRTDDDRAKTLSQRNKFADDAVDSRYYDSKSRKFYNGGENSDYGEQLSREEIIAKKKALKRAAMSGENIENVPNYNPGFRRLRDDFGVKNSETERRQIGDLRREAVAGSINAGDLDGLDAEGLLTTRTPMVYISNMYTALFDKFAEIVDSSKNYKYSEPSYADNAIDQVDDKPKVKILKKLKTKLVSEFEDYTVESNSIRKILLKAYNADSSSMPAFGTAYANNAERFQEDYRNSEAYKVEQEFWKASSNYPASRVKSNAEKGSLQERFENLISSYEDIVQHLVQFKRAIRLALNGNYTVLDKINELGSKW